MNTLDGVTLDCDLELAEDSQVNILDGLTLNGTATIGGSPDATGADLNFVGSQSLEGTGDVVFGSGLGINEITLFVSTLTVGPNIMIHGSSGTIGSFDSDSLINQGTIEADGSGFSSLVDRRRDV